MASRSTDQRFVSTEAVCPDCAQQNPVLRSQHYLELARMDDVKFLEEHLTIHRHRASRRTPDEIREGIKDTVAWVTGEMHRWQGMVDERTGEPLSWWTARDRAHTKGYGAPESQRIPQQAKAGDPTPYAQALLAVAQQLPLAAQAWAHCHVEMIQRGLGLASLEDTAKACEEYALQYPDDAAHWQQEAAWWREGAPGRLVFTSSRAPMMTPVPDREPGDDEEPF